MKRILVYILLFVFQFGFSQEVPKVLKTKFSKEALHKNYRTKMAKRYRSRIFFNSTKERFWFLISGQAGAKIV
jgi:hypothetical protein